MSTLQLEMLIAIGLIILLPTAVLLFRILASIMQAKRRQGKPLICDGCGKADVRPSWQAGAVDRLLTSFGYYPYKCRACHSRFYRFQREASEEQGVRDTQGRIWQFPFFMAIILTY